MTASFRKNFSTKVSENNNNYKSFLQSRFMQDCSKPKISELLLNENAGKIIYCSPNLKGTFEEKAWRISMELNGKWARSASSIDFSRVSEELKKRGYREASGWPVSHRIFSDTYVFRPKEGGLVLAICQLAREGGRNPWEEETVKYYDTNTDTKEQQDFLKGKAVEYVDIISSLLRS